MHESWLEGLIETHSPVALVTIVTLQVDLSQNFSKYAVEDGKKQNCSHKNRMMTINRKNMDAAIILQALHFSSFIQKMF